LTPLEVPAAFPSGEPPPERAWIGDGHVALDPLAQGIYERYRARFPEYEARYGDTARAWGLHDTKYLLAWAALDADFDSGGNLFVEHVTWLAHILHRRAFPLYQLVAQFTFVADALTVVAPDRAALWDALARRGSAAVLAAAG
jgi:hypothetical protein